MVLVRRCHPSARRTPIFRITWFEGAPVLSNKSQPRSHWNIKATPAFRDVVNMGLYEQAKVAVQKASSQSANDRKKFCFHTRWSNRDRFIIWS